MATARVDWLFDRIKSAKKCLVRICKESTSFPSTSPANLVSAGVALESNLRRDIPKYGVVWKNWTYGQRR